MGKKQLKKKIKKPENKQIASKNVKGNRPNQSDSPLTFDLSNKNWLKGITISKESFTNKLKDKDMFIEYITELFHNVIPLIQKYGLEMIKEAGTRGWRHCHPIDEEKIDLTLAIIEDIHGHRFDSEKYSGPQLWQFGVSQNIRLIAIYDYTSNYLTPLFIDYHHLLHPDKNFNQPDYDRYTFCPIENALQ